MSYGWQSLDRSLADWPTSPLAQELLRTEIDVVALRLVLELQHQVRNFFRLQFPTVFLLARKRSFFEVSKALLSQDLPALEESLMQRSFFLASSLRKQILL